MSLWSDSFFQNTNEIISGFLPSNFCTFLKASWKLFGASCRLPCLWYYIPSPQKAQKASRKPPGSYKNIPGRNPEIITLVFWKKLSFHMDILRLTDLYRSLLRFFNRKNILRNQASAFKVALVIAKKTCMHS